MKADAVRIAVAREMYASGEARAIRQAAHLSQGEVARAIGACRSAVAHWEIGNRLPRGDLAVRVYELLTALSSRARQT
jgi:DNA-binding transcriptional regulator YiaG